MNTLVTLPNGRSYTVSVEVLQHIADLRQQNAALRKVVKLDAEEGPKVAHRAETVIQSPKVQAVPVEPTENVFAPNPAKSIARNPPIRFGVKTAK